MTLKKKDQETQDNSVDDVQGDSVDYMDNGDDGDGEVHGMVMVV